MSPKIGDYNTIVREVDLISAVLVQSQYTTTHQNAMQHAKGFMLERALIFSCCDMYMHVSRLASLELLLTGLSINVVC